MKQIVKLLTLMCRKAHLPAFALMALLSGLSAHADVVINETTFPDANFRNFILSQTYGQDGVLTDAEIEEVEEIDCDNNEITSLKGIEYFTGLIVLNCRNNQLTELDVSNQPELYTLICENNRLTSLDISNNTKLHDLACSHNQLIDLNLGDNAILRVIEADNNQLVSIDVSQNTGLSSLRCRNNRLTSLDLSNNTSLLALFCDNNLLTNLDVSNKTGLWNFNCSNNQLTALDITNCPKLKYLGCQNNQLTTLDVVSTQLDTLNCSNNLLVSLNISDGPNLRLNCSNNQLTSLDLSNFRGDYFNCDNNRLTEVNLIRIGLNYNPSYKGQVRDLTAESALTPDGESYYYFRLDENTDGDKSIVERMTETNYGGAESKFNPSAVREWTNGGVIIEGQKRVVTNANNLDSHNIKGKILLLKDVTEDATTNTAFGTVKYTYKSYKGVAYFTDDEGDFTLNWTAPIPSNQHTEITELRGVRKAVGVTYTNLAGQSSDKPFDGINIVTTRYSDGTTNATKIIK